MERKASGSPQGSDGLGPQPPERAKRQEAKNKSPENVEDADRDRSTVPREERAGPVVADEALGAVRHKIPQSLKFTVASAGRLEIYFLLRCLMNVA